MDQIFTKSCTCIHWGIYASGLIYERIMKNLEAVQLNQLKHSSVLYFLQRRAGARNSKAAAMRQQRPRADSLQRISQVDSFMILRPFRSFCKLGMQLLARPATMKTPSAGCGGATQRCLIHEHYSQDQRGGELIWQIDDVVDHSVDVLRPRHSLSLEYNFLTLAVSVGA